MDRRGGVVSGGGVSGGSVVLGLGLAVEEEFVIRLNILIVYLTNKQ